MQLRLSLPFIGGWTQVYEHEEVEQMKKNLKVKWSAFKQSSSVLGLAVAEVGVRVTVNAVQDTADVIQEAAYKLCHVHDNIVKKQGQS